MLRKINRGDESEIMKKMARIAGKPGKKLKKKKL